MGVSRPKRTFEREFKLAVVRQLLGGEKRAAQICREHGLSATLLQRWKQQYEQHGEEAWPDGSAVALGRDPETRIQELEASLGQAHLETELLRRALKAAEKGGFLHGRDGR